MSVVRSVVRTLLRLWSRFARYRTARGFVETLGVPWDVAYVLADTFIIRQLELKYPKLNPPQPTLKKEE
jgi:hypothetical protein